MVNILYISVYSENGNEIVQIKNVILKEGKTVLLNHELNKKIIFEKNAESIYDGWIDGGRFTEETLEIMDGKEYELVVEIEVIKNGVAVSEDITFETIVKGYKSFVFPT